MTVVRISTRSREEVRDITQDVAKAVDDSGVNEGFCLVWSPHTTCGITVNEGYDPAVQSDALSHLRELVPQDAAFEHSEGNSDSHIKSMLIGPGQVLPVSGGRLRLGRWQAVFMCEYDGPREREVWVVIK